MSDDSMVEENLGVMAQRFYEASGLNLSHTSKPEVVAGLRAAFAVFERVRGEATPTADDAVRYLKDSGVSAAAILFAVSKVYDMEMKS